MDKSTANQILDGAIISDAGVYPTAHCVNPRFKIGLAKDIHIDWMLQIKEALITLGVNVYDKYPKTYLASTDLRSSVSPILSPIKNRWYNDKTKIVPYDLIITPIMLANWFMGDGSSTYIGVNKLSVVIMLHTDKFTEQEVNRLISQLKILGLQDTYLGHNTNKDKTRIYPIIKISTSGCVGKFMDMIIPYMCKSFEYKIKYAKY
jgi:hypothetical protein